MVGIGGEQADVLVEPGRLGVVVAGADVAVAADPVGLLAHHEQRLGVGLEADEPVDDVHAGLLERAGPADVRRLVEARLELDQDRHLLAPLGRPDQRLDDRAVARGAVERELDGQHLGVADAWRMNSSTDVENDS